MNNEPIKDALTQAVAQGLDLACTANGILPPAGFTREWWAQGIIDQMVSQGDLPTQEDLNRIVAGMPALFVSDRNK